MRNYDKYRDVKYLQKTDVEKGALLTINKVVEEDVSPNDRPEKIKYVIHFEEKGFLPWVPNIGSLKEISIIAGTGDVDEWPRTVIVVYVNPDVEFGGEKKGGIRCRAPKAGYSKQAQVDEPQAQPDTQDWVGENPEKPTDEVPF